MKNLRMLTILALVALSATGAQAFDLATTAAVEIVEGVSAAQTTEMDFGQVADHDGDLQAQRMDLLDLASDRLGGVQVYSVGEVAQERFAG